MPTYEYACTACAERLEVFQSYTEDSLTECPACLGRLRKVFSPVGIVFKGSGFYKNDSRGKPASSGADTKTDTKTDAKSDALPGAASSSESGSSSSGSGKSEPAAPASTPASTPSPASSSSPAASS